MSNEKSILTVTVELGPESKKLLETLLAGLVQVTKTAMSLQASLDAAGTPFAAPAEAEAPAPVEEPAKVEAPAEAPAPAPVVTRAELKNLVIRLSADCGKNEDAKAKIRALVHEYAQTVPAVPEDKIGELFARLQALDLEVAPVA